MNEFAFTTPELQNMIYAPEVNLHTVHHCAEHRQTLFCSLEANDKEALEACLASMLNTNATGSISHIATSGLGVVVKDIALADPAPATQTAKRLALLLTNEWLELIRSDAHSSLHPQPPSPTADCRPTTKNRKRER
jgi:hypothetical protein